MNINYTAPCNPLGYGVAGLNIALALQNLGVKVAWWPIGQIEVGTRQQPAVEQMIKNAGLYDIHAPSLRVWHQHDMAQHIGKGLRCGFPIFELDRFNAVERHSLKQLDCIFVCSKWAEKIVREELGNDCPRVYVAPLGVDRSIFNERVAKPDEGWTTFINVGKWEIRKGHDILCDAFNLAFEPRQRVRLWMMNHNIFLHQEETEKWQKLYTQTKMGKNITFLPRVRGHWEVAQIMAEAHCGVFPARAEGWNLELLEMMSLDRHVIATDYAAHTEFCTKENCKLIHIDTTEDAYDGIWFHRQGKWASLGKLQIDQMVEHMRAVHKAVQSGQTANPAGVETAKRFTWENTARCIVRPFTT